MGIKLTEEQKARINNDLAERTREINILKKTFDVIAEFMQQYEGRKISATVLELQGYITQKIGKDDIERDGAMTPGITRKEILLSKDREDSIQSLVDHNLYIKDL